MVYWSPEDDSNPQQNPTYNNKQAPPIGYNQDLGVFKVRIVQSQWIQAGQTARFMFRVNHVTDGAITTSPVPVLAILDRYGGPSTLGITVPASTILAGTPNTYYSDVQFTISVQAGDYVASWTATYTPIGSVTALPIAMKRAFKIEQTVAPSPFFFWRTSQAAQS